MNTRARLLLLVALLARLTLPGYGSEQSPPGGDLNEYLTEDRALEVAEDMEILASILQENLRVKYEKDRLIKRILGTPGGQGPYTDYDQTVAMAENSFLWHPHAGARAEQSSTIRRPLGAHLPGLGVVLQVEIPAPRAEEAADGQEDEQVESRWERTRRTLREDQLFAHGAHMPLRACQKCHTASSKAPAPVQDLTQPPGGVNNDLPPSALFADATVFNYRATTPSAPTLDEVIAAVVEALAENGHHLRHLRDDEQVCVVLSYRTTLPRAAPGGSMTDWAARSLRAPLPSRVTICASKNALDQAAQEDADPGAFGRAVTIRRFTP